MGIIRFMSGKGPARAACFARETTVGEGSLLFYDGLLTMPIDLALWRGAELRRDDGRRTPTSGCSDQMEDARDAVPT